MAFDIYKKLDLDTGDIIDNVFVDHIEDGIEANSNALNELLETFETSEATKLTREAVNTIIATYLQNHEIGSLTESDVETICNNIITELDLTGGGSSSGVTTTDVANLVDGILAEKQYATKEELNNLDLGDISVSYTNDTYGYENATVTKVFDDILNIINYVSPTINQFNVSPSTTTYEIGSSVASLTFNWVTNKVMTSQSLTGCTITATDKTATYSSALTGNKTFTLTVSDGKNTVSKTITINFYNKKYYGVASAQSTYNSNFLLGLTGTLTSSKSGPFTVTAGNGQYIYFAVPTLFGTCNFSVGGFSGGFDLVDTISFTNASGYTSNYYIYRSKNPNLGDITVTVS